VLERDKATARFPLPIFCQPDQDRFRGGHVREVEWPVDARPRPLPYLAQDSPTAVWPKSFSAPSRGSKVSNDRSCSKRILASLLADPQFRNQMIDEAHVAMSLNHSNIVQVLDLGHARGRYFLVLELVEGWDLNQILNRARAGLQFPLLPELALYVVAEVCRALGYAHAKTRDGQPRGIVTAT